MDNAVAEFVKRKYNLLIGERTAEEIKIQLGSAFPLDEPLSMEVRGRNLVEGIPQTITVTDDEVRQALDPAGQCDRRCSACSTRAHATGALSRHH